MDSPRQSSAFATRTRSRLLGSVALGLGAAIYVALRLAMNREFAQADWETLVDLRAPLPYGHRILVPSLARVMRGAGVPIAASFAVAEWLATVGLIVALRHTLRRFMPPRPAIALSVAFLFVLPLAYLLAHRWPIFYPWDTPGMVVVVLGLYAAVSSRPRLALLVTAVGALNRETAAVVPILYVLIGLGDASGRRKTLAWAGLMVVAFVVVRQGIAVALPDNPGAAVRLTVEGRLRVLSNLHWLARPSQSLAFAGAMGGLPIAWGLLSRSVPVILNRLHILALATAGGLLIVANVYEPRAFGVVLVLAYVPVSVGLWAWMSHEPPMVPEREGWLRGLDRYGGLVVALVWVVTVWAVSARLAPS